MTENSLEAFVEFCREKLESILNCSGHTLYSGIATIQPGSVYLLGNNPGSRPEDYPYDTICKDLDDLTTKGTNNYLDGEWKVGGELRPKGSAPLQRRAVWLLSQLGLDPRSVAASNLVFVRSRNADEMPWEEYADLANLCWPVHERILEIVAPRVVLVFGNSNKSPYRFLKSKFNATYEATFPSGHGDWMCRSFQAPGKFNVVGLPHLSRYDVIGKSEVIDWIKPFL